ncbi:hypothetical protein [Xanthomonas campestris]|uniref:hypothetical protein n=1 Tax=Xanthomonas campestris TaxID=339 RepID=UPI001C404C5A|nr:hypothetical protein [Xanthomonas campestris]MCD0252519.1 hypothetical protein [Xanthomonas campestris pv. campestris]MCD0273709.1 hypothetical protein [Xanthomonas campestris pv. campestris]MCF8846080.1 hypothetical protein [Xanthomonas campestris pv. campestris]MDM7598540.1 hypothetical protein [Xanthomonas campestris pv. campestris]MDM7602349.1 hypothetical protein [Xanthomonas campestris pv. campestris]
MDGSILRGVDTSTYVSANGNAYCAYEYTVRACNAGGCSAWSSPPFPVTQGEME